MNGEYILTIYNPSGKVILNRKSNNRNEIRRISKKYTRINTKNQ